MSIRKALGRSATRSKPSLRGPTGLGVWNVPSASHRSCQASSMSCASAGVYRCGGTPSAVGSVLGWLADGVPPHRYTPADRKSTRLNSSHGYISYAVFCLKKKRQKYWIVVCENQL